METILYGDWEKVKSWAQDKKRQPIDKEIKKAMMAWGRDVIKRLKKHIEDQDLEWAPLSPATKKTTKTTLLEKGEYKRSIKGELNDKDKFNITLDIYPHGTHSKNSIPMDLLGSYHEFGTSKMPSRPLWRPVANEAVMTKEWKAFFEIISTLGFNK